MFRSRLPLVLLIVALVMVASVPAFAQTATPVPTAVPTAVTTLNIPTGVLFTETNTWLEVFGPIAAIGIGIAIALAVLAYLGKMIVSAFKS